MRNIEPFFLNKAFPCFLLGLPLILILIIVSGCDKLVTETTQVTVIDTTLGQACLTCHTDSDDSQIVQPREQWENSRHASTELLEATVFFNGDFENTAACGPICHSGNGFVDFIQTGSQANQSQPSTINCFTCHSPHTGNFGTWTLDSLRGNAAQVVLKDASVYDGAKSNMCVHCHQAATVPILNANSALINNRFGPHSSTQANMLIGRSAFLFDTIVVKNSHDSTLGRDGCLTCHFGQGVGASFGEHTFRLEDESGSQLVANCNVAACHVGTLGKTRVVQDFYQFERLDTIAILADSLEILLRAEGILDPSDPMGIVFIPQDTAIPRGLAQILYNYLMFREDGSRGVHNAAYSEQILRESLTRYDSLPRLSSFSASDTAVCFDDTVLFRADSSNNVTTFSWAFGDGTVSSNLTADSVKHVYNKRGIFTVSLTGTGKFGSASVSRANYITVDSVASNFSAAVDSGKAPLNVAFLDLSTGTIDSWEWDFGDTTAIDTSSLQNPIIIYQNIGTYTVQLRVTSPCNTSILTRTGYIKVTAP
ncbi:MAG: PKD domain-containing protein [candidate division Zixibacteria bacterium]|nr:PKD domain-containing protein [candidate division Zixibacteria bacterium]